MWKWIFKNHGLWSKWPLTLEHQPPTSLEPYTTPIYLILSPASWSKTTPKIVSIKAYRCWLALVKLQDSTWFSTFQELTFTPHPWLAQAVCHAAAVIYFKCCVWHTSLSLWYLDMWGLQVTGLPSDHNDTPLWGHVHPADTPGRR